MLLQALMSLALADSAPPVLEQPHYDPPTYQTQTFADHQYGWNALFICGELKDQTLKAALSQAGEMASAACASKGPATVVGEQTKLDCSQLQKALVDYSATVTYYCRG